MNTKMVSIVAAILVIAGISIFVLTQSGGFSATESVCGWFVEPDSGPRMCFEKDDPDYRFRGTDLPKDAIVSVSVDGQFAASGPVDSSGQFTHQFESDSPIASNNVIAELTLATGEVLSLVE